MSESTKSQCDQDEADRWQYLAVARWGLDVPFMTKRQGFSILHQLQRRVSVKKVASDHSLREWGFVCPSGAQMDYMRSLGIPANRARTKREAGLLLDAKLQPSKFSRAMLRQIDKAIVPSDLDWVGADIQLVIEVLPPDYYRPLVEAGKARRQQLGKSPAKGESEIPE